MKVPSVVRSIQRKLSNNRLFTAAQVGRSMRHVSRVLLRSAVTGAAFLAPILSLQGAALAKTVAGAAADAAPQAANVVTPLQGIILGLVQGLTEFIPVSSSAHLNIAHALMGQGRNLTYDVILSIGTTVALAYYFRNDWARLMMDRTQAKLRNLVFVACIPAVVAGVLIHGLEDKHPFKDPWFNALMLLIFGFFLFLSEKLGSKKRQIGDVKPSDAWTVGCAQALALVPGISRSGSTMTAGMVLGFRREDAARFSFLMSLPISVGAVVYSVFKAVHDHKSFEAGPAALVLGVVFSGISGFWAIGFLLNFLKTKDVTPFFIWRAVVAVATWLILGFHSK